MNKEIVKFLNQKGFSFHASSRYVINYYREHYDNARDGAGNNEVTMHHQREKYTYGYSLDAETLSNDRDGALIVDVYDTKEKKLIKQVALEYYFGVLETAYRESDDDTAAPKSRLFLALAHVLEGEATKDDSSFQKIIDSQPTSKSELNPELNKINETEESATELDGDPEIIIQSNEAVEK